jgi:N-acetylmuramoyl-L-alanine amidase
MTRHLSVAVATLLILALTGAIFYWFSVRAEDESMSPETPSFTETEAGFEAEPAAGEVMEHMQTTAQANLLVGRGQYTIAELAAWQRPAGPVRVGLQVGHLNNENPPEELAGLTRNGAGAVAGIYNERDTVEVITEIAAEQLRAAGIEVDVLPAVIPPGYVADAFVAIHADGNNNSSVRGYKMAGPRRDYSGQAEALVEALYTSYEAGTDLPEDFNISRRMTAYYAFNWPRYEHAVHPRTPSAIVEVGFLTNPVDRAFMLNEAERAAAAISAGILSFLDENPDPVPTPLPLITPDLPITGTVACAEVRAERRNRDPRPCEAALFDDAGNQFLLVADDPIATSTLPYEATVNGTYYPAQVLDNYFWFHWEVLGLIEVTEIDLIE